MMMLAGVKAKHDFGGGVKGDYGEVAIPTPSE